MAGKCVVARMAVQSRQNFVTANNRLLQSVGASKLLDDIMNGWLTDPRTLYVGGGNAAARFDGARRHGYRVTLLFLAPRGPWRPARMTKTPGRPGPAIRA